MAHAKTTTVMAKEARQELDQEERLEEEAMAARHRPDERAPDEPPDPGAAGDVHAVGATGGGSAVGGLGGTNVGGGSPENADIDAAAGSSAFDVAADADEEDAYTGIAGGAVGGTPAGKRTRGGRTHGGIAPGGVHRGDSTVGGEPRRGDAGS
ncbi:MAG TPA: hypothetical protein VMV10_02630 [Pirellulales bacterium]|nr:hypothetical protein [Pirellulales bacterium]HVA45503.1 hypothetical protein [Pirellulales bacterium]